MPWRQFPFEGNQSIAASPLGRALISQSMLVHGRGSYPRIGWFDSIDCDYATRSLVEALHASNAPSHKGAFRKLAASTLERWFIFCRCRTAVSTPASRAEDTGSIPVTDSKRIHSLKPYTQKCWFDSNPAKVGSPMVEALISAIKNHSRLHHSDVLKFFSLSTRCLR